MNLLLKRFLANARCSLMEVCLCTPIKKLKMSTIATSLRNGDTSESTEQIFQNRKSIPCKGSL